MGGTVAPLRDGDAPISTAAHGFTISKQDLAPPEISDFSDGLWPA
jgi:hypothetical protein